MSDRVPSDTSSNNSETVVSLKTYQGRKFIILNLPEDLARDMATPSCPVWKKFSAVNFNLNLQHALSATFHCHLIELWVTK